MQNEILPTYIEGIANVEALASDAKIAGDNGSLSFDVTALTANRVLFVPDGNSTPLHFNATSIGSGTLPAGANNTIFGIAAGVTLTTGTGNILFGQNTQSGSITATNRIAFKGTAVHNDCFYIDTTDVHIPNLAPPEDPEALGRLVYYHTDSKLYHGALTFNLSSYDDGSAAAPSLSFHNDQDTGFYRIGSNQLGVAAGGAIAASFSGTQAGFLNGSETVPSLAFISDTNTGFYRFGANEIGLSTGGNLTWKITLGSWEIRSADTTQLALTWNNTTSARTYSLVSGGSANGALSSTTQPGVNTLGLWVTGTGINQMVQKWNENQSMLRSGTATLPVYSFFEDIDTGIYRVTEDTLGFSTGGVNRITINDTSVTNTLPFMLPDGTRTAPSFSFAADTNIGINREGSNAFAISIGFTDFYCLTPNVDWNFNCIRQNDLGAISNMWTMNVVGNGFNDADPATYVVYKAYGANATLTAYNFIEFYNNSSIAWRVRGNGDVNADGAYSSGGADYSEWFEAKAEIPVGTTVVLVDGKIRKAQPGEEAKVLGVIRPKNENCCVVIGNSAEEYWNGKFLKDEYGQFIMESVDYYRWVDDVGESHGYYSNQIPNGVVVPENKQVTQGILMKKLNPAYDASLTYVPRSKRPEWHIVGMLGQIPVKNGEVLGNRWQLIRNIKDGSVAKLYLIRK